MLVLGDGFRQLEPPHYLKGKAVCQISQGNSRSVGRGGGETAVMIFGFRIGAGPVFAGYVRNRAAVRGRRQNGDKVLYNKIGNLALFIRRQRSNFV